MLDELRRSLASEREARESAYQERSLMQIELEAKQRRWEGVLEESKRQAEEAGARLAEAHARAEDAAQQLAAERTRLAGLQVRWLRWWAAGGGSWGAAWPPGAAANALLAPMALRSSHPPAPRPNSNPPAGPAG